MPELIATPQDVTAAYRLVLGRDPDPAGFDNYLKTLAQGAPTTRRLLAMFLHSTEFSSKEAGEKVDIGGGVFVVVDPAEPEFGQHIARDATWEPHIVATIRANLAPGQVFVDVGANVGVMSFTAAHAVGPGGKVIGFEPNDANARYFLRGVFENGFQEFVHLHRVALSEKAGLFALRGGSNTHLVSPAPRTWLVQAFAGDDLLGQEPAVHLLKIDIEGHEPFALKGLAKTIRRHKPKLLCVFNPRCLKDNMGVPAEEFARQIFGLTRRVQVIEHDGATREVKAAKDLMELWSRRNEEAVASGLLPDGMIHFDLLFRPAA
jgi:FkbM family methyltransferase